MRPTTILSIFVLAVLLAYAPARGGGRSAEPLRYAVIVVQGDLAELPQPLAQFTADGPVLHDVIRRLDAAAADPSLQGVVVVVKSGGFGWAKAQELRDALGRCRKAGRETVCLLESGDNLSYYVASGAEKAFGLPTGQLMLTAMRAEILFARRLLDKIGVEAQFIQAGEYKSAAEPLTRTEPTPEFRESLGAVLQSMFDQMVTVIVEGRGLSISRVNALIRGGPYTTGAATEAGLLDVVVFRDEVARQLLPAGRGRGVRLIADYAADQGRRKKPASADLFRLLMGLEASAGAGGPSGPTIAVLHVNGPIVASAGQPLFGQRWTGSEQTVALLQRLREDAAVRAIVLRVNSPGGGLTASDTIRREVKLTDHRKPVIASFSDTAASGGYLVATGARRIIANPGSLTGSIGVLGGKLVVRGLYEKIGLDVAVIERGGQAGLLSPVEEFTPAQRAKMEALLQAAYETFISRVDEGRPELGRDAIERVAQGRVWTGEQAFRRGLVDELGGLHEALAAAREAAGIPQEEEVSVIHYPEPVDVTRLLFSRSVGGIGGTPLAQIREFERAYVYVSALLALGDGTALCIMPGLVTLR